MHRTPTLCPLPRRAALARLRAGLRPAGLTVLVWLACVVFGAGPARAQSLSADSAASAGDVAALRDEMSRLREEVADLRAMVAALRAVSSPAIADAPRLTQAPPPQVRTVSPEAVDMLRTQVGDLAQVKVESSTRLPVKLSGTILTNVFSNSGEANWLENPNLAGTVTAGAPTGSFSATARQSRLGVEASGIAVGSWQAGATLIADFMGGVPNFATGTAMGLPRLVYGFAKLERDTTTIEAGQDHALLAPLEPTSLAALSFPLLFRSGNLYLRAPQARVDQRVGGGWTVSGALLAPLAGDFVSPYEFAPVAGAGERSRRPGFEARLAFDRADTGGSDRAIHAGLATHYGWLRAGADLNPSWAVAADVTAQIGRVGVAGEVFAAKNLRAFGAAASQLGRSAGGWAEGRLTLTSRARAAAGFGLDNPREEDRLLLRTENRSWFGNVIFDLTPEVSATIEYRWLRTSLAGTTNPAVNHHVNAGLAIRF